MIRVGLTGGLACGKTFVGKNFAKLGCHVVRADELGHQVLAIGGEAYDAVVQHFGQEILNKEDGQIDRKRLAAIVFADANQLSFLNGVVHPAVFHREEQFMAQVESLDPHGVAIVEAAILIESGNYKKFDRLVVVVCGDQLQVQRAIRRDGTSLEEVQARLRRQMPNAEKRTYADFVVDTSGSKESTVLQVKAIYESLRSLASQTGVAQ